MSDLAASLFLGRLQMAVGVGIGVGELDGSIFLTVGIIMVIQGTINMLQYEGIKVKGISK